MIRSSVLLATTTLAVLTSLNARAADPLPVETHKAEPARLGESRADVGAEVTRRKAYTAALQRVSTADYTKRVTTPGAFNPGQFDAQLATGAGGVPIKAGEDTIGGIAAGGAPGGDKDEACAQAGIDKIKDRLN